MSEVVCLYERENNSPLYLKIRIVCETVDLNTFKITIYYSDWPYSEKENNSSSFEGEYSEDLLFLFLKTYGQRVPNGLVNQLHRVWHMLINSLLTEIERKVFKAT